MKDFLTPATGKVVSYPDHFAELKPYLIEVTHDVPCVDCVVKAPEEPQATESKDNEKTKPVALVEPTKNTRPKTGAK